MISKKSQNNLTSDEFRQMAYYFGIAIQTGLLNTTHNNSRRMFMDAELFFLTATLHLKTSRMAEGFLCWLLEFGHLLMSI